METKLYIKNMVCDRCRMAVDKTLRDNGFKPVSVELGEAVVEGGMPQDKRKKIASDLKDLGFELLDDKRLQVIEKIKSTIIDLVHYRDSNSVVNLSDYIADKLHSDYSSLSRLFSEFTGMTIERYYIEQRIERVKELICYDELSLTQIALQLNYSSVAYLSSQFKSVTGMTPSQFKSLRENKRKALDKIVKDVGFSENS